MPTASMPPYASAQVSSARYPSESAPNEWAPRRMPRLSIATATCMCLWVSTPDNHRLRFVQVRHAVRHCRLLGLRRWLVRAGGQDCDGPFVRQAPIGSRPIRSASYRMIRRWAMTDRSKRGHEVSQLEGQAITHRHPPVSPSDTDRRENDAHSQLDQLSAFSRLPAEASAPVQ